MHVDAAFEEDRTAGDVREAVGDEAPRAGFGDGQRQLLFREQPGHDPLEGLLAAGEDVLCEPRLDPRPRLPELVGRLLRGGRPGREDQVVLREIGIEAHGDAQGGQIRIGHGLVHGGFRKPEELEGRGLHVECGFGKGLPEEGDHPFGEHFPGLGGNARDDRNDFPCPPHGKSGRRSDWDIAMISAPSGKSACLALFSVQ